MVGLPVHEAPELEQQRRAGRRADHVLGRAGRALGIPEDRWVFLHAGADASDHWFVSNRDDLHSSPAIRTAGPAALELAGIGIDDLAHVDLYSCFPSAVQVAARELGLGLDRQLTVTGGMSFAGGPWNNYTMHGIATMAGVLRDDPGIDGPGARPTAATSPSTPSASTRPSHPPRARSAGPPPRTRSTPPRTRARPRARRARRRSRPTR